MHLLPTSLVPAAFRPLFGAASCSFAVALAGTGLAGAAASCVPQKTTNSTPGSPQPELTAVSLQIDPDLPVIEDGPWRDPSLTPDERAALLVAELTENEKLSLIFGYYGAPAPWKGYMPPAEARLASAGYVPGVSRLGIPPQWQTDAGMGVASQGNGGPPRERTALPSTLGVTATWNRELARETGAMIGKEARASGFNVLLAGSVNLQRTAYGGRNFEYGGEDPFLAGAMVGEQIAGAQSANIICTVKHFAVNAQETDRKLGNSILSDAAARVSDLMAFELAIETGQPGAVMCAYNQLNGEHACESEYLLKRVLREDWKFPGYVLSDWGGVHSSQKAAQSGLEQQSGWPLDTVQYFQAPLKRALAEGEMSQERLDQMVHRILRSMLASGLFEHPVTEEVPIDFDAHDAVSQKAAEEAAVLLKNDGVLPLSRELETVALIGGHANVGVLSGGGSAQVYPRGGNAVVGLQPTTWPGPVVYYPSSPARELKRELPEARVFFDSGQELERAIELARRADVAIVFATHWSTESLDTTLELPKQQNVLIGAVAEANPRTVVVLQSGTPNLMPWATQVSAIVQAWFPGTSGGRAIARVLSGAVNPSGHLPLTIPLRREQLPHPEPPEPGEVVYSEGAAVGYKWFDAQGEEPLFEFGHGLSYTSFAYEDLSVEVEGPRVSVSFTVRNEGERRGKDVAQIYLAREGWEAPQRLGQFAKVELEPRESRNLSVEIDPRLLATWDSPARVWQIAAGGLVVRLASSSRQVHASQSVVLNAATLPASQPSQLASSNEPKSPPAD